MKYVEKADHLCLLKTGTPTPRAAYFCFITPDNNVMPFRRASLLGVQVSQVLAERATVRDVWNGNPLLLYQAVLHLLICFDDLLCIIACSP
jgi:hypothetical protein